MESAIHHRDASLHHQEQIFDRSANVLGNKDVGRFAPRGAAKTNPIDLSWAVAIRYKNFGHKPKSVIFLAIYQLQRKSARFSENTNANVPSRDSALTSLDGTL